MCCMYAGTNETSYGLFVFLKWSIVEQFLNEINMREEHSSTAVTLETKCVQSIPEKIILL